jgi:Adenylate cyclase, family 3 (some proteins contain HAMP domain)
MITENQLPQALIDIIDRQVEKFSPPIFTDTLDHIPHVDDIPSEVANRWIKIPEVICVFVDMKNSTKFSATHHASTTANVYTLFTGTAVRLMRHLGAEYIDVKGDGVFALFNQDSVNEALCAAISFKTFITEVFTTKVSNKTEIDTGVHIGIDQHTLLVSKIGLRKNKDRSDMFNEVWAGKAVNMAAKLSSLSKNNEILVSDRFFKNIKNHKALYSCPCSTPATYLWDEVDLSADDRFSFNKAFSLASLWCKKHGKEFMSEILK